MKPDLLLDEIAADAMTASEDELRAQLSDAGVDPDRAISDAREVALAIGNYLATSSLKEVSE